MLLIYYYSYSKKFFWENPSVLPYLIGVLSWIPLFVFILLSLFIYSLVINKPYVFLISFIIGFSIKYIGDIRRSDLTQSSSFPIINKYLYLIQNRCFSFFLIHGGVLLFFVKYLHLEKFQCFIASFICAAIASHFHYELSNIILKKVYRRVK